MDTQTPPPAAPTIPTVSPVILGIASSFIDPVKLHAALGEKTRWRVVRELADGSAMTVQDLAARLRVDANLMTKHLNVLRAANALELRKVPGGDGRKKYHQVPPFTRAAAAPGDRLLDYGCCVLRFP
jgi:DNA-binding transcriptional ArsR family regulator